MFGFGKKDSAANSDPGIPAEWLETVQNEKFQSAIDAGITERLDASPYALAITDKDYQPLWVAPSYRRGGNMLVTVDMDEHTPNAGEIIRTYHQKIRKLAHFLQCVSPFTMLIVTQHDTATVHRELTEVFDIKKHSFTVIDLNDGCGIGWDALSGALNVIEPMSIVPADEE